MTKEISFRAIRNAFYFLLCNVLVIFVMLGCTRDVYDPNGNGDDENPNPFPFSTTATIQLNVKYFLMFILKIHL